MDTERNTHFLISSSACSLLSSESRSARRINDRTSPQEPFAIYKYLMKFADVPCSKPFAIFVEMEIAARSTCLFSEYCLQSKNVSKTSTDRSIASCQIFRSSNLPVAIAIEDSKFSFIRMPLPQFLNSSSSSGEDFTHYYLLSYNFAL